MATQSRARHFHATAKALNAAASTRGDSSDGMRLTAEVSDVDIQSIIAGAGNGPMLTEGSLDVPVAAAIMQRPASSMGSDDLVHLHEELRWAESKLMQASERLAEAQEAQRKDLVALAIMRRELLGSFLAERRWLEGGMQYFRDQLPTFTLREEELAGLVAGGVRTESVIFELAAVRTERKLLVLALGQSEAQVARIDDNETTSEFQVASEAYDRDPDGNAMREVARLRGASTRARREALRLQGDARELLESLDVVGGMGEVTAAAAFLAAEYEGDGRSADRMEAVRAAQAEHELRSLPEPEADWKAGLKHPVQYMRARRTTR
ncbi:MAG: hypothetical protein H7287_09395 [Thermoleophilia bacterium]|nr:hypothetical protein [Thermoleophilia bacterium]